MAGNLHVIYRISDKGNPKPKLPNGGKGDCLRNAVNIFNAVGGFVSRNSRQLHARND